MSLRGFNSCVGICAVMGLYMQKSIKNGFTAEKCNFHGAQGYTVKQWNDGACVCSQFIPVEAFRGFCNAAGIDEKSIVFL